MRLKLKYLDLDKDKRLSSKDYTLNELIDFAHQFVQTHNINIDKQKLMLVYNFEEIKSDEQLIRVVQEDNKRNSRSPAEILIQDRSKSTVYQIMFKDTCKLVYPHDKTLNELHQIVQELPEVKQEQLSILTLTISCNEVPIDDQENLDKIWQDSEYIKKIVITNKIDDSLFLSVPPILRSQTSQQIKKYDRLDYRNQSFMDNNPLSQFTDNETCSQLLKSTTNRRRFDFTDPEEEVMRPFFSSFELKKYSQQFQLTEQETLKLFHKQFFDLYDTNQAALVKAIKLKMEQHNINNINIENANDFLTQHNNFPSSQIRQSNNFKSSINKSSFMQSSTIAFEKNKFSNSITQSVVVKEQASSSIINQSTNNSSQIESSNRYEVQILNYETMSIDSEPKKLQQIKFMIGNSGKTQWAQNTYLCNIQGAGDGSKIKVNSLKPNEKQEITAEILSPNQEGDDKSSWRLFYGPCENPQYFGPIFTYKINVKMMGQKKEMFDKVLFNLVQIYPEDKQSHIKKHIQLGLEGGQNEDQIYNSYIDFKNKIKD